VRAAWEQAARIRAAPAMSHYALLEVAHGATKADITVAYRALILKLAPDKIALSGLSKETATELSGRVNEAYRVLKDPATRAVYDASLKDSDDPDDDYVSGTAAGAPVISGVLPRSRAAGDFLREMEAPLRRDFATTRGKRSSVPAAQAAAAAAAAVRDVVSQKHVERLEAAAREALGVAALRPLPASAGPPSCAHCGAAFATVEGKELHEREAHADRLAACLAQIAAGLDALKVRRPVDLLNRDDTCSTAVAPDSSLLPGGGGADTVKGSMVLPARVWSQLPQAAMQALPAADCLRRLAEAVAVPWTSVHPPGRQNSTATPMSAPRAAATAPVVATRLPPRMTDESWVRRVAAMTTADRMAPQARSLLDAAEVLAARRDVADFIAGAGLPDAAGGSLPDPDHRHRGVAVQAASRQGVGVFGRTPVPTVVPAAAPTWETGRWRCQGCNSFFALPFSVHHCRGCGGSFCDACSGHRVSLPRYGLGASRHRVCEPCARFNTRKWAVQAWRAQLLDPGVPKATRLYAAHVIYHV
jgi:hypothetical protein